MHNLYFYNNLMERIRSALDNGTFEDFYRTYAEVLGKKDLIGRLAARDYRCGASIRACTLLKPYILGRFKKFKKNMKFCLQVFPVLVIIDIGVLGVCANTERKDQRI